MFEPLHRLFRRDEIKVRNALKVFERITQEDLGRLIRAHQDRNWTELTRLTHKLKSGCMQLGQNTTADALSELESALTCPDRGDALEHAFVIARDELHRVLDDVGGYLDREAKQG